MQKQQFHLIRMRVGKVRTYTTEFCVRSSSGALQTSVSPADSPSGLLQCITLGVVVVYRRTVLCNVSATCTAACVVDTWYVSSKGLLSCTKLPMHCWRQCTWAPAVWRCLQQVVVVVRLERYYRSRASTAAGCVRVQAHLSMFCGCKTFAAKK